VDGQARRVARGLLTPHAPREAQGNGPWLAVAVGLASPLLVLWLIASYGVDVPRLDDWSLVTTLRCGDESCLTWSKLGRQHVESRPVTSRLMVLALAPVAGFNVRALMLASLAIVGIASLLLLLMARASLPGSPSRWLWLWALANAGVFGLAQAETWLLGAQVCTYLAIATLCGGLALASGTASLPVRVLGGMGIATAATFSMTSGLMTWLLLPPVWALGTPRRQWVRWLAVWALGCAAVSTLYFWGFEDRSPGEWQALREPHRAVAYTLVFLGAPFGRALGSGGSDVLVLSGVLGAILIGGAAGSVLSLVQARDADRWRRASPFIALAVFTCGVAAMAALGRLSFGLDQALSPRYTAWSIYLAVSLLFLVPIAFEGRRGVLRGAAVLAALGVCLHSLTSWQGLQDAEAARRDHLTLRAAVDFARVAPEPPLLRRLFPWPERLIARAAFLSQRGLMARPLASSGRVMEIAASRDPVFEAGAIHRYVVDAGALVLEGWAVLPEHGEPAHAVLLCAEVPGTSQGDPRIVAVVGTGRPQAAGASASGRGGPAGSGWNRRLDLSRLRADESLLTAWAYDSISGRAVRLAGEVQLESRL
jgi:hypothetical protein